MSSANDLFRYSPDAGVDPGDDTDFSNDESEDVSEDDSPFHQRSPLAKRQYTEIKEQMYQDKLAELKRQLGQLNEGSHPDWTKKLRRLENAYKERLRINTIIRDLEIEMVEQDFVNEKKSAVREFEDQKVYLRDQLISELEEKQKMIETERHNMELTGDSMELKPISTRKLRRRANEPSVFAGSTGYGNGEKRRKPTQLSSMTYLLEETDIIDDLKIINKNKAFSMPKSSPAVPTTPTGGSTSPPLPLYPRDIRIEDGKLFYEKRWFRRGQAVQVDGKNGEKFPAMISAIGSEAIWVRKTNDSSKIRIYLTQLSKGKYFLKRRAV